MAFLILGIIIFIVGSVLTRARDAIHRIGRAVMAGGIALAVLGLLIASVVQIDAGEIGIKTLFGKVQPDVLTSGLHFINPLIDVTKADARTQNYTMSAVHDEGKKAGDDAIRVLSADGLEVIIDLTVLYRIIPAEAPRLLRETGLDYENKIVRPITRTKIRDNAVYYDAVSLYSTRRDEFQGRISRSIEDEFHKRGLIVENILVRNIALPATVKTSIEQKIQAEQEAQKMQFVLQKERQEADRKRVEAQGIADYQKIVNENLTDKQLQYEQIKAMRDLAGSQNAKMIIMNGRGTPVMLDARQ
jgi:regulator of protease activity HflC (stomatin/prohibitin superfamily)